MSSYRSGSKKVESHYGIQKKNVAVQCSAVYVRHDILTSRHQAIEVWENTFRLVAPKGSILSDIKVDVCGTDIYFYFFWGGGKW